MSIIPSMFGRKQQAVKNPSSTNIEPMNVDILEPFMDAISFISTSPMPIIPPFATANMDWKETPTAHVFITDLPGVKKDEVKIEVEEEKILKISGQRNREAEDKNNKWHRVERNSERFLRTVRLPPNANTDNVQAALENGVLTVTVPKEQENKSYGRLIPITN